MPRRSWILILVVCVGGIVTCLLERSMPVAEDALFLTASTLPFQTQQEEKQNDSQPSASTLLPSPLSWSSESLSKRAPTQASTQSPLTSHHFSRLPRWMQEYLQWHSDMRKRFPDEELVTNPAAPKLLVRDCLRYCAGLSDRLAQLELDIYLAYCTNRLWMVWWASPSLESYLQPPVHYVNNDNNSYSYNYSYNSLLVNWTVPLSLQKTVMLRRDPQQQLPRASLESRGSHELEVLLQSANTDPLQKQKVLKYRLTSSNYINIINELLSQDGQQLLENDSYHHLFYTLFQPHPRIQQKIDWIKQHKWNNIKDFNAIHWRLRYPRGVPEDQQSELLKSKRSRKNRFERDAADHHGLAWEGKTKEFAIQRALHGLQCVAKHFDTKLPLFVYADSLDLIRYLAEDLPRQTTRTELDDRVWNITQHMKLLTSYTANQTENLHIYHQRSNKAEEDFDPTFIDLFLASHSHCVAYGLGRFGVMAAKLLAPEYQQCQLLYQLELWKVPLSKLDDKIPKCLDNTGGI